jgi:membrane protease YdiL (CAAX protease family)
MHASTRPRRGAAAGRRPAVIAGAWLATLLISRLPEVALREVAGVETPWIHWLWIGLAAALVGLCTVWMPLRALRGYAAIMLVVLIATTVLEPALRRTAPWAAWFDTGRPSMALFGERLTLLLATLAVILALRLMGLRRRDFFLVVGRLDAPAAGVRLPGMAEPAGWHVVGALLAILLLAVFAGAAAALAPPAPGALARALPLLPLALVAAALNAFSEEMLYRAAPLSQLAPAVGAGHALWITSVWFGLGHVYGGIPSGPAGLVFAGGLALVFGKAMLETRGMGWPWAMHSLADAIIYTFLAMAAATA